MIKKRDFSPTGYLLAALRDDAPFLDDPCGGAITEDAANPFIGPPSPIREFEVDYGPPCRVAPSYLNVLGE